MNDADSQCRVIKDDTDPQYKEMRDIWTDYNHRQEFEHTLIDRKTTWLLTAQALLFAAYGVTFDSKNTANTPHEFRTVVAWLGVSGAAIVLLGVVCLIYSKRRSWRDYHDFFVKPESPRLPEPLGEKLEWGVRTKNTWGTLAPDFLLPFAFIGAWCVLLI